MCALLLAFPAEQRLIILMLFMMTKLTMMMFNNEEYEKISFAQ